MVQVEERGGGREERKETFLPLPLSPFSFFGSRFISRAAKTGLSLLRNQTETFATQAISVNTSISVFLFFSKVSVFVHFQESISMRWLFPIQTFISLVIHYAFKWPRQEAKTKQQPNKTTFTATRSQEHSPTNRRRPTKHFLAPCHRDLALIG